MKELEQNLNRVDSTNIKQVEVGMWKFKFADKEMLFPQKLQEQALVLIGKWAKEFPKENTWVQRTFGVPTLILRLDATTTSDSLGLYEIEERPAGIGISSILNPTFAEKLNRLKEVWPKFAVFISPKRKTSDDPLWLEVENDKPNGRLLLVRVEPEEEEYHHLEPQSVSSLLKKGDKSYGPSLGLWKKVSSIEELDFREAFVLKPLQGSKTRDVYLWHPERLPGTVTRTKIENALVSHKAGMFIQPFIDPMRVEISGAEHFAMFRVYFGFNPQSNSWDFLGGLWNCRPNVKIHGASDAVFGPVPAYP